jgi:superfamily I DNA/RNA helicase
VLRQVLADERAEAAFIAAEIEAQVAGTSFLSMDAGRAVQGHGLAFHQIAVLVRLSAQADAIEEALDRSGIPCHRRGDDAFAARPQVADILARLRRHVERKATDAPLAPVADLLAALIPDAAADPRCRRALELLQALAVPFGADAAAFLSEMALARETDLQYLPQKVALLTLHASKGLEFPLVFIAGCEDGLLPFISHFADAIR